MSEAEIVKKIDDVVHQLSDSWDADKSVLIHFDQTSEIEKEEIARIVDHTNLKPEVVRDDILKLCDQAERYGFYSVCVNPSYVNLCRIRLNDSRIKVCTVVGFPFGATTTKAKVKEATIAESEGADEIDMVLNIGHLKDNKPGIVYHEIASIRETVSKNIVIKVILENGFLSQQEIIKASLISYFAGANYIKTSTGFNTAGAKAEDVALMKYCTGGSIGIKAAGGIRSAEAAKTMIRAGATRLGTSASVEIMEALSKRN